MNTIKNTRNNNSPNQGLHTLAFWCFFLLLNTCLFVPACLMNYETSHFLPKAETLTLKTTSNSEKAPSLEKLERSNSSKTITTFWYRSNQDLFRLCGDLLLLFGLLIGWQLMITLGQFSWKSIKRFLIAICTSVYLILLSYQIYYAVSLNLYGAHPYFKNDWVLVKEVLPIYLEQVEVGNALNYGLGLIAFFVLIGGLIYLWKWGIRYLTQSHWQVNMGILSVLLLIWGYGWQQQHELLHLMKADTKEEKKAIAKKLADQDVALPPSHAAIQHISPLLWKSAFVKEQGILQKISNIEQYEAYQNYTLENPPNLYVIFIESYGQVLSLDKRVKDNHLLLLDSLDEVFANNDWHVASHFTESPVGGGRSWLAYSSFFCGLKIKNQLQYNEMLHKAYAYPHLMRFLKTQGYTTIRLKTMQDNPNITQSMYVLPTRFYAFDEWVKHGDIPYTAYKYDHFGGIPDQYALHYTQETYLEPADTPTMLFFITMNSHLPWFAPPPIYENWEELNNIKGSPHGEWRPKKGGKARFMERNAEAVAYELKMLNQFILQNGDEEDLFVLIGDHHPPGIGSYKNGGRNTPIHILSKNETVINSLQEYGMEKGMKSDVENFDFLKHEALFSILTRTLLQNYGAEERVDTSDLPLYFPDGLPME
ncbi:MAG: sulfatase-like hydrolase/transferase [Chitinophagales bacterium]